MTELLQASLTCRARCKREGGLTSQGIIPVFIKEQLPVYGLEKFRLNFSRCTNCEVATLSFALYYAQSTLQEGGWLNKPGRHSCIQGQRPAYELEKFKLNFSRCTNCEEATLSFALYYAQSTLQEGGWLNKPGHHSCIR